MFVKRINCVNLPFVNEVKKVHSNTQPFTNMQLLEKHINTILWHS